MTINKTWAINANDREFKSADFLIRSCGSGEPCGNFRERRTPTRWLIQPEIQQRLRAIGDWLAVKRRIHIRDDVRTSAK